MPGSAPSHSSGLTVEQIGETALIERLRARVGAPPSNILIGIGDDAAVMEPPRGEVAVVTTDALVEDVHFRRGWTDARTIGAKAVAVTVSDLAAMGATPNVLLLSLALPATLPVRDFDALVDGVLAEAGRGGSALVGGNIARSTGPLVIDVTAIGSVGRRRVLRRSGGRAGDELYLTGSIGAAAAGLAILTAGKPRASLDAAALECVRRYEHPEPRLRCGRVVGASRSATACIDLSDGLADAVRQLAGASGAGAFIDAGAIPIADGAPTWLGGDDPVMAAISGGEDYELLFAVPPRRRRSFLGAMARCRPVPVTRIGVLTRDRDLRITIAGQTTAIPEGFRHFRPAG